MKSNKWFILGTLLLICGLIFEVYLLTDPWQDMSTKAALGDAINGMTAPFIGIVGSVLIYISFVEQVKANKFQFQTLHEQRELDLLFRLYMELKDDLSALQEYYGTRHKQNDILNSFMNHVLEDNLSVSPYADLTKYLDYLFKQFSFISLRICKNEVLSDTEKIHLIEKIRQLFNLYFESHYTKIVETNWTSKFSLSFKESLAWAGQSIINLNQLSIEILKEKHKRKSKSGSSKN